MLLRLTRAVLLAPIRFTAWVVAWHEDVSQLSERQCKARAATGAAVYVVGFLILHWALKGELP